MSAAQRQVKFEVSEEGAARVELAQAILVYKAKGGSSFATVHGIAAQPNGGATILPGRPMTAFAVARLARTLTKRRQGGFIADKVLYQDTGRWRGGCRRRRGASGSGAAATSWAQSSGRRS